MKNVFLISSVKTVIIATLLLSSTTSFAQEKSKNIYQSQHQYVRSDGSAFDFRHLKNKVVLLAVWASWCAGCIDDHPKVQSLQENLKAADFEVVYVSTNDDEDEWKSFLKEKNWDGINILLQKNLNNPLSKIVYTKVKEMEDGRTQYQVAVPNYFLIDRNGNGFKTVDPDSEQLVASINKLLDK